MRRRKDPFEKPWVIIAAVVGIIAVVVIALLFFMGGGSSAPVSSGQPATSPGTTPSSQQTLASGVAPTAVRTQTPSAVPAQGVYVHVNYIGGFSGTYGMEGNMSTMRNSGDRYFVVENATGIVSAVFHKEDSSTRHELVAEIYKDGRALQTGRNSSAFGIVSVSSTV